MKRYLHIASAGNKPRHTRFVQFPLRGQNAKHDTIGTEVAEGSNLCAHFLQFRIVIEKITEPSTDHHIDLDVKIALYLQKQRT